MNSSSKVSASEFESIKQLRKLIGPQRLIDEDKLNSNMFLLRYLRAGKFNLEKTEKMIRYYVDYIKSHKDDPTALIRTTFPIDFQEQFRSYVGGRDNDGRPLVMITDAGKWNVRKAVISGREQMFISYFHKVCLLIESIVLERDADYAILIADVSNIPYANYVHRRSFEVLIDLVYHLEKCAPGVLKKVFFVNAPKIWIALFAAVQAIITISAEIITFGTNEKTWKAALREYIPEDGICAEFGGTSTDYMIV